NATLVLFYDEISQISSPVSVTPQNARIFPQIALLVSVTAYFSEQTVPELVLTMGLGALLQEMLQILAITNRLHTGKGVGSESAFILTPARMLISEKSAKFSF
ncbi:hypothetical protein, partial [Paenibacillus phoenicis]|uniref:hypothetical protein n=1 Tax=Paenibacillus phoenicis TaxID=554117 RepID=UPI003D2C279A